MVLEILGPDWINFAFGCSGSFIVQVIRIPKKLRDAKQGNSSKKLHPVYYLIFFTVVIAGGLLAFATFTEMKKPMYYQSLYIGLATETFISKIISEGAAAGKTTQEKQDDL